MKPPSLFEKLKYQVNIKDNKKISGLDLNFIHQQQCNICPLQQEWHYLKNPNMKPYGSNNPDIYILGEAPGKVESDTGIPFTGPSGEVLHLRIPEDIKPYIRYNNVVRTKPPQNRNPTELEIECFPAGTFVNPIGKIKTLYRRWYDGTILSIKTTRGNFLTGTPNHPIFTLKGKIPLKHLQVGDYLFSSSNTECGTIIGDPNGNNKPIPIDQIFNSFSEIAKMERMRSTALDFHGDGIINSNIDIIRTDSLLRNYSQIISNFEQEGNKFILSTPDKTFGFFSSNCSFSECFLTAMIKPLFALFPTMGLTPNFSSLRRIPNFNSIFLEIGNNPINWNFLLSSNFLSTFTSHISLLDFETFWKNSPAKVFISNIFSYFKRFLLSSENNPTFFKNIFDSYSTCFGQSHQFGNTGSIDIEFDQIVSIDTIRGFSGHIYNLETESHSYMAQNLLVSNCCRPSIEQDIMQTKPKAIFALGNIALQWLIKETGITKWNGKRAPVRIGNHTCWAYFHMHPSYVARSRREGFIPKDETQYGSDIEFAFALDLRRAFEEVFEDKLEKPFIHTKEHALKNVRCITGESPSDLDDVISFLDECNNDNFVGLDYETNALRPYVENAKILTVAIARIESTLAFALHHREAQWNAKQLTKLQQAVSKFIKFSKCKKIAHNLAFELEWSAFWYGKDCVHTGKWEDTIVQAWVLHEKRGTRSLDFLCKQYFGLALKDIFNIDRDKIDEYPLDQVLLYNALDAKYDLKLFFKQRERIEAEGLENSYKYMLRRVPTMVLTQLKGVSTDQDEVDKYFKKFSKELKRIEDKIAGLNLAKKFKELKGKDYRPSAPFDTKFVINSILKKNLEDTTQTTLAKIKEPLINLTLKWRGINKQLSTYVKPFRIGDEQSEVYPDGLLHAQFKAVDTDTSRTSCTNPNLQNQPSRKNKEVKSQIKVSNELIIAEFDYSGIQARNVAQESRDRKLIDAFWEGFDIHGYWMEVIAKRYPQWIEGGGKALARDKDLFDRYRHLSKNQFVFPTFFGAAPNSISFKLNIPKNIMTDVQNQFWDEFPDIKPWHKRKKKQYDEFGYVSGLSGMRRRAPMAYTELINSMIQADEAFIVMNSMYRLSRMNDLDLQANCMVHDSLLFIWDKRKLEKNTEIVVKEMLRISPEWLGIVPLEVERKIGSDWSSLAKAGKYSSINFGHIRGR